MPTIVIDSNAEIGMTVSPDMFGGNILFDRDRFGSGTYDEALQYLGVNSVRYPGGAITEQFFDVNNPNATTFTDPTSGNVTNLLPLSDFLAEAASIGFQPSIVIPTVSVLQDGPVGMRQVDAEAVADVESFVADVLNGVYGDVSIAGFEIGNEYSLGGQMDAAEYGKVANELAKAIQSGIDDYAANNPGSSSWVEPTISIQIGRYGAYDTTPGFVQNNVIMGSLDDEAVDAIDAVLGNYYIAGDFDSVLADDWFFDRFDSWANDPRFANIEYNVGEWNTDFNLGSETGLLQAGTMLNAFSEMVAQGVDAAWIWPVQQNTSNDLFGDEGDLRSTFGGEVFKMMSESVSGSTLTYRQIENDIATFVYQDELSATIFVASLSDASVTYDLDLSFLGQSFGYGWSTTLGTTGSVTNPNSDPILTIDSDLSLAGNNVTFDLDNFEVIKISLLDDQLGAEISGQEYVGSQYSEGSENDSTSASFDPPIYLNDVIVGSNNSDNLYGYLGDDILSGGIGDDILDGGNGNDILNGGDGADMLIGGGQTDTASYVDASGGMRIDLAYQGRNSGQAQGDTFDGIEDLSGSEFSDMIYGDSGDNTLIGRGGDDWLQGRDGDDALFGGSGDDVLAGGLGADLLDGGSGIDRAQYFLSKQGLTIDLGNSANNTGIASGDTFNSIEDLAGSQFDDQLTGDVYSNTLIGNAGNDRLDGAGGDDILLGGSGADTFVFKIGSGADVIRDYDEADLIELDIALLDAIEQNGAAVLNNYASLNGSTVQLDFGEGDILTIANMSDYSLLYDAFIFG